MKRGIVVVGSLSVDFVMRVPRRPAKGETVSGYDFNTFVGGKGNNQALAAARAGATVHMIGRVGKDQYGERLVTVLNQSNVDTTHVIQDRTAGTGIANIYVDSEGDNSIVIIAQANGRLSNEDVAAAMPAIEQSAIMMLQLEVPYETVIAAAKAGRSAGVRVMLNPAPAPINGRLPAELLANVDLIIPNQTEAEILTGVKVTDQQSAISAAVKLQQMGISEVIVTMGEQGLIILERSGVTHFISPFRVTVIDTTAAGDAFCGAVAAGLAEQRSLKDAATVGCAAGALACTRNGAEPSLPQKAEIEQLLATTL